MMASKINPKIVPLDFPEAGIHPERILQRRIIEYFYQRGFLFVEPQITISAFEAFDLVGIPQFSPIRNSQNTSYITAENDNVDQNDELVELVAEIHRDRFGYDFDHSLSHKQMLVSHTTALLFSQLLKNRGVRIFTISKTFRNRPEKNEQTQAEFIVADMTVFEVVTFMEEFFSFFLRQDIGLNLVSDFYYFCEPSFSFLSKINGVQCTLGSGGYIREPLLGRIIDYQQDPDLHSLVSIGLPLKKLLNLSLGVNPYCTDFDYNASPFPLP